MASWRFQAWLGLFILLTTISQQEAKATPPAPQQDSSYLYVIIIVPVVVGIIVLTLVLIRWICCCKKESSTSEEQLPINTAAPQKDYSNKLVSEFGPKGVKTCSCFRSKKHLFKSLRLAATTCDGCIVLLDDTGFHIMSDNFRQVIMFPKWKSQTEEYVAMATVPRNPEEILVAKRNGEIAKLNIKTGEEKPIVRSLDYAQSALSDIATDDAGNIYAADGNKSLIYIYNADGSYKESFGLNDSPRIIGACGDGDLFVGSGTDNRVTIKKYAGNQRKDYDIKGHLAILPTRLYASQTSLYVRMSESGKEASSILKFSAEDGQYMQTMPNKLSDVVGMEIISEDKLAFFDSERVLVYKLKKGSPSRFSCCF